MPEPRFSLAEKRGSGRSTPTCLRGVVEGLVDGAGESSRSQWLGDAAGDFTVTVDDDPVDVTAAGVDGGVVALEFASQNVENGHVYAVTIGDDGAAGIAAADASGRRCGGSASGFLDAGPFFEGVEEPMDGTQRFVLNDVRYIVGDPHEPFRIDPTVLGAAHPLPQWALRPIPSWDVGGLSDLREFLREAQRLAEHGRPGGETEKGLESTPPRPHPVGELAIFRAADVPVTGEPGALRGDPGIG